MTGKTVFVCEKRSYNGLVSEWRLHDNGDLGGLLKHDGKDIRLVDEAIPDGQDFDRFVERHFRDRLLSSNDYYKQVELAEIPCAENYSEAIDKLGDGVDRVLVKARFGGIPEEHQTDSHGDRVVVINHFVARNVSCRFYLLESSPAVLRRFFRDKLRSLKGVKQKPRKRVLTHLQTGRLCSSLFHALPAVIRDVLEMRSPAWTRSVLHGAAYLYDMIRLVRRHGIDPANRIRKELKGIDLEATKRAWERWVGRDQNEWTRATHRKAFRLLPTLARHIRKRRAACLAKS